MSKEGRGFSEGGVGSLILAVLWVGSVTVSEWYGRRVVVSERYGGNGDCARRGLNLCRFENNCVVESLPSLLAGLGVHAGQA